MDRWPGAIDGTPVHDARVRQRGHHQRRAQQPGGQVGAGRLEPTAPEFAERVTLAVADASATMRPGLPLRGSLPAGDGRVSHAGTAGCPGRWADSEMPPVYPWTCPCKLTQPQPWRRRRRPEPMTDGLAFPIAPPVNCWDARSAAGLNSALELLAYRSNLLGADRSVANWGGGNTSSKTTESDFRHRPTRVLWVKGSGSDLATIQPAQFTGLRMDDLLPLLERESMSDEDLVAYYEHAVLQAGPAARLDRDAAAQHAALRARRPHASRRDHRPVRGARWTRPGRATVGRARHLGRRTSDRAFRSGKKIALAVRERPEAACVLMAKHGLVTWGDTAEACYAPQHRHDRSRGRGARRTRRSPPRLRFGRPVARSIARVSLPRCPPCAARSRSRQPMILHVDTSDDARAFADRAGPRRAGRRRPACPDHLVHTKPWPLVLRPATLDVDSLAHAFRTGIAAFEQRYAAYVASARPGRRHARSRRRAWSSCRASASSPPAQMRCRHGVAAALYAARHRRAVHHRGSGWLLAATPERDVRRRVLADGAVQARSAAAAARAGRARWRWSPAPPRALAAPSPPPGRSRGARGHRRPQRRRRARGRRRNGGAPRRWARRWRSRWT